jgi:hypothetical protein
MTENDEVRTTVSLPTSLHVWLRQYAIGKRVSFARLVADILIEWAKNHGFSPKPDESGQNSQP